MKFSKKIARKVVFPTMMALSIDKLIRRSGGNRVLNIIYHGVVEEDATYFSPRSVEKWQFEKQMAYIKKHFDVVSVREAFKIKEERRVVKRPTIAISFDDGFKNNLTTALPIIERYQLPVTFFVASALLTEEQLPTLWSEKMAALRYFARSDSEALATLPSDSYLKSLPPKARDSAIDQLVAEHSIEERLKELPEEVWKLMSREELIKLSESPYVEIGSHGHLHYNLGEIPLEDAKQDMTLSRQLIGEAIGREVEMIAYPDGSYSQDVKRVAMEVGYKYQLAVQYYFPEDSEENFIFDRHGLSSTTTFESNMISLNLAYRKMGSKF